MYRLNTHPQDRAVRRFIRRGLALFVLVGGVAVVLGLVSACHRTDHPSTVVGELAAYAPMGAWTGCTPGPVQAPGRAATNLDDRF